ncbi:MAG: hypothetical protein MH252_06150 [Thermosynechococcaceae cyanobacterium MS004]|nr:hypothetical protein [Thermosynechococcaceae cyanobacterium MS004]
MDYLNYYQGLGVVSGVVDLSTAPQTITIDETAYPISFKQKARNKLQPGQTQNFRVYPRRKRGKLTFKAISVVSVDPAPFVLKDCWETHDDEPRFIVYRNQLRGQPPKSAGGVVAKLKLSRRERRFRHRRVVRRRDDWMGVKLK